jgi:hypothetical protein
MDERRGARALHATSIRSNLKYYNFVTADGVVAGIDRLATVLLCNRA